MDINNQFDQEMLSAYLDDALTAEELGLVENWLASDPAAATYLNELRSNRNTLKAIAGLPAVGLRPGFADQVMARALEAASNQNRELRLPESIPELLPSRSSNQWWKWSVLAAAAAAVAWLAFVPTFKTPSIQPIAGISTGEPSIPKPADPSNEPVPSDTVPNVPEPKQPGREPPKPDDPNASGKRLAGTGTRSPDELHSPDSFAPLQMIFIGDAVMSKSAWESGKFDQLLDEFGIRYEKELVASKEMIEGLIESQTIVGPDADSNSRQEAALVYIDCPAVALSKMLVKLEKDGKDFVNFNVTMAMNGGGLGLPNSYDKLMSALKKDTSPGNGRGIARLIMPDNASPELGKLLTGFEVVEKTMKSGGAELAALVAADAQMKGNKPAVNDSGQMLLILRKQQ